MSRAERRESRRERARESFGDDVDAALDVLELLEYAWHDCYGEITPPEDVIDDVFVLGSGDLAAFVAAARLALIDRRDTRLAADARRR